MRSPLAVALTLFVLAACTPPAPLPPAPVELRLELDEYSFELSGTPEPGRVVVEVDNVGALDHEVVLVILPEDVPPILEQLRSEQRRTVATLAYLPPRAPGERGSFALDLEPGRYAFLCFVQDDDGPSHALKGMALELRV
jgi:hypothetical protein